MGVFEQFPYTNMQNANMDWILRIIQRLEKEMDSNFNSYISEWIDEHYDELFFNASYNPDTETIIFAKGGNT